MLFSIIKAIWSYLFPILYFLLYYIYYVFQNWHIRACFPTNSLVRWNVFRFCFENHWIQSNCKFTKSYLSFENLGRWLGFSTTSVFYHCFFCTWAWKQVRVNCLKCNCSNLDCSTLFSKMSSAQHKKHQLLDRQKYAVRVPHFIKISSSWQNLPNLT